MLRLRGVGKTFADGFVLGPLDFDIKSGEVHILMGENGSGKSALMQIVSAETEPDYGEIRRNGDSEVGTVYIRQDMEILENLTVAENIFYHKMPFANRLLGVIDQNKLNRQCADLIAELDLPFSADVPASALGLAQKQILGFCRAFVSDADIVILDEPAATLTDHDQLILHAILGKMKERGTGIVYITHDMGEVRRMGDRISVMRRGRVAGTLSVDTALDDDIIALMSGMVLKNRYPRLYVEKGDSLLKVEHLNAEPILRDISFEVRRGEVVGITGLAGSGRSCLANCLFGIQSRDGGRIMMNGNVVDIGSPADAIEEGIALVPEDRIRDALIDSLDVPQNVSLSSLQRFARFFSLKTTFLNQTVLDYLQKFNIESFEPGKSMKSYSPGIRQKIVLAKWFMKRSRLFILDEPTRSLDIPSRVDIYNAMNDLVRKGAGVIFISSDFEEILGMCDRILVLSGGRFVCDLPGDKTSKEEIIAYATTEPESP